MTKLSKKDLHNVLNAAVKHHLNEDEVKDLHKYLRNPTSAAYDRLDGVLMAAVADFEKSDLKEGRCMASTKRGRRCANKMHDTHGFCVLHNRVFEQEYAPANI